MAIQARAPAVGSFAPKPSGLILSEIAAGSSSDPDGCPNQGFASQGRVEEDDEG
jgi:hypothetical protein